MAVKSVVWNVILKTFDDARARGRGRDSRGDSDDDGHRDTDTDISSWDYLYID